MSLWTVYAGPMTAPFVESITENGVDLLEPEGYEAVADRITIGEDIYTNMVSTFLTLEAREEGFVLDRLRSLLDYKAPIRLLLVAHPEEDIVHAIHLPSTTLGWTSTESSLEWTSTESSLEWTSTKSSLEIVGKRDYENDLPMRRDFWFGSGVNAEKMGFLPGKETS